jgi:hypothetical protein
VTAAGVLAGLFFYAVDFRDAQAEREAARAAAAYVREQDPQATVWYVGHWGFQFYAEHAGMRPVVPNDAHQPLRRGDWLVVPDTRLQQQLIRIDPERTRRVAELEVRDALPLRTVQCFYGTGAGVPLEHHRGPRVAVTIYRVTADFVPAPPW